MALLLSVPVPAAGPMTDGGAGRVRSVAVVVVVVFGGAWVAFLAAGPMGAGGAGPVVVVDDGGLLDVCAVVALDEDVAACLAGCSLQDLR